MYENPQGLQSMGQGYPVMQPVSEVKHICIRLMNFYVVGQLSDGSQVEGIIEDMDDNQVTMLVPEDIDESEVYENRQWGYGGYWGGYGRRRFRRFRRRRFPFNVFVYPFFFPFPFYY